MNVADLEQFGLNPSQIRAYVALVMHGTLTPPKLAKLTNLTRTNAYELLGQLEALGLAYKDATKPRHVYRPAHPSAFEKLIQKRKERVLEQEQRLRTMMPQLMTYFYTFSEQPGVRFYQGEEGIKEVLRDILRTKQDIKLVRTRADQPFLGRSFLKDYIREQDKLGLSVDALTPYHRGIHWNPENDKKRRFRRTWMREEAYTAPVQIEIYGDKVAFVSYGQEAIATIIESPQIAESMRQLFELAKLGAKHSQKQDVVPEVVDL